MSAVKGIKRTFKQKIYFGICRMLMIIWSAAVLFPLIWTIYSSLKDNKGFYANPWALPTKLHFENYYNAWIMSNVSKYFLNSMILLVIPLFLSTLMAALTAYVVAKFQVKWKKSLVIFYTVPLFIPQMIVLVPQYFLARDLHMTNSIPGLIVFYSILPTTFAALQLTAFFKRISNSLSEAAKMDGCTEFGIFFKIMLPLVKPGLATVGIVSGFTLWNEYVMALTFLSDEKKFTVPIGIANLSAAQQYRTDFGALFAGLTIALVPMIVLYVIFQRYLLDNTSHSGAIKG